MYLQKQPTHRPLPSKCISEKHRQHKEKTPKEQIFRAKIVRAKTVILVRSLKLETDFSIHDETPRRTCRRYLAQDSHQQRHQHPIEGFDFYQGELSTNCPRTHFRERSIEKYLSDVVGLRSVANRMVVRSALTYTRWPCNR